MGNDGSNKLLQAALSYAKQGLCIFPLKPGEKRPAHKGWQQESTTDPAAIAGWWRENPAYNIGIDCEKSGILVVDYDAADGKPGLQERAKLHAQHNIPDTWTVKTPRGGIHEYYKGAGRSQAGIYPGVDIRAAGGLVVAPPSVFNGNRYQWERAPIMYALADATNDIYEYIEATQKNDEKTPYRVPDIIPEHERTDRLIQLSGSLIGKGLSPAAARAAIKEENALRCEEPLTDEELERDVFPALTRESWKKNTKPYTRDRLVDPELLQRLKELDPVNNKRYGMNDAGSARLFIDTCGARIRYIADRECWFYYDGKRWDAASGKTGTRERLKELADALCAYALTIEDQEKKTQYLKYAGTWQRFSTRETILKDAASVHPAMSSDFDKDPYLFNCKNGTLNLQTMEFHEHRPEDLITKLAGVNYDPTASAPRWNRFIDEIMAGDQELIRHLQKAMGYALSGDTRFECLYMLYGPSTRNGKTTCSGTMRRMMGDYGASCQPETLAKKRNPNSSAPSDDLARLAGVRFLDVAEPPKDMPLNVSTVKQLTGDDPITCRHLHERTFDYKAQCKMFINTNHLPRVDDMTIFTSGRIQIIPFNVHFSEEQRDTTLKRKLTTAASLSGILNWAIEGWRILQEEGLKTPQVVRDAVEAYREKEDKVALFLQEMTEKGADYEVTLTILYNEFCSWCYECGCAPMKMTNFKEQLEQHQFNTKKKRPQGSGREGKTAVYVLGLRINA